MPSTTDLARCYAVQNAVPSCVATSGDVLPALGADVAYRSRYTATDTPTVPVQVIGLDRQYGATVVSVVLHTDECPVRCIATKVRPDELHARTAS